MRRSRATHWSTGRLTGPRGVSVKTCFVAGRGRMDWSPMDSGIPNLDNTERTHSSRIALMCPRRLGSWQSGAIGQS